MVSNIIFFLWHVFQLSQSWILKLEGIMRLFCQSFWITCTLRTYCTITNVYSAPCIRRSSGFTRRMGGRCSILFSARGSRTQSFYSTRSCRQDQRDCPPPISIETGDGIHRSGERASDVAGCPRRARTRTGTRTGTITLLLPSACTEYGPQSGEVLCSSCLQK